MLLFSSLLTPDTRLPRWGVVLLACLALLLGWWYWVAAVDHGERRNVEGTLNDQKVYMNGAATMVGSGYTYFVPRMRMPGYMLVLSVVADPKVDHVGFFSKAKQFNVTLSLVCLVLLFFGLRPWLGTGFALCLVLMIACQLFILRAAYVQPEIMLGTLILFSVALLVEVLRHPVWWKALLAGLVCCGWHLTKASALVAVGGFFAALLVKAILVDRLRWKSFALAALLVLVGYLLPMSPYLWGSYERFGSPFYNAQSRFFIWSEHAEEKYLLQQIKVDQNLAQLTPGDLEKLPSAAKYLKSHTAEEILKRVSKGTVDMLRVLMLDYTLLTYLMVVWPAIMLWAVARHFDSAVSQITAHWVELVYVTVLLVIFIFLFGWFTPLKVGPRLIATMCPIPLFFCMAVTHHFLKGDTETILGTTVSVEKLLLLLFFIPWVILTMLQVPADLAIGYFGG